MHSAYLPSELRKDYSDNHMTSTLFLNVKL